MLPLTMQGACDLRQMFLLTRLFADTVHLAQKRRQLRSAFDAGHAADVAGGQEDPDKHNGRLDTQNKLV